MRLLRCLLVGATALAITVSVGASGPAASAAPAVTTISNTPTMVPFAQTNGDVTSMALFTVGGVPEIAFGGDFTTVTTPDGVVHPATNFAVVTEATGAFVFAETTLADDGYVRALAYNAGTLYVGGDFTTFGDVSRSHLVALTVPGFAVNSWNPGATGHVQALAISQSPAAIYSAGSSGTVRSLNLTTGKVNWSDPVPYGGVEAMLSDPADGGLYVGGFFDSIDGFTNHGLIELNEATGAPVTTFTPVLQANSPPTAANGDDPRSLGLDNDVSPPAIISGGGGSQNRMHLFNGTTGAQIWNDSMIGDTQGVIQVGTSIIAGYHRTRVNKTTGGQWPYFTGQVQETTGAILGWTAGLSGRPASDPPDGEDNGVRAFLFDPVTNILVVGGDFLKYGQTCDLQVSTTCTGGVPMASLAEYQVTLPQLPPSAPTGLVATPKGPLEVDLSWTAATPGTSPVTGYQVSRNGTVIATTSGTTYKDISANPNTTYQYTVVAVDANQLVSPSSTPATATTPPPVAPAAPTNLSGSASGPTAVSLTWTAAVAGTYPVAGYTVLRNGVAVGSTSGATSFTDTGLNPSTAYDYTVTATDTASNTSAPSGDFMVSTLAAVPPSAPTSLSGSASGPTVVDLNWTAAVAGTYPVAGYTVLRNGVPVGTTTGATTFTDTGLTQNTSYDYTVTATDTASNTSAPSGDFMVSTPAATPPSAPPSLTATANGPLEVDLVWSAATPGSSPVTGYQVSRDGTVIATTSGTTYTDLTVAPNSTYNYAVSAIDANLLVGPPSLATATTAPAVPPSAPSGLTVVGTTSTQVNLSWTAAAAGTYPVVDYTVWRDGVALGSSSGLTSFTDTGLSPNTTYDYTVTATDAGGGTSVPSGDIMATTSSAPVAPSAPSNLIATANGAQEVDLTWAASTPGSSPIAGYQVSRNGTVITTTTVTSYHDVTVSPNTTYSYSVTAVDLNNLLSAPSNTSMVTTPLLNLLTNPGFETWSGGVPANWTTYGPATVLTQSSDAHSGSSSIKIGTTNNVVTASGINDGSTPTIHADVPGVTYLGSCWVKVSKPITVNIQMHEEKPNGQAINAAAVTSLAISDTNWHLLQVSYTTIGTGDIVPLTIYSTNTKAGAATFEVDDCVLGRTN